MNKYEALGRYIEATEKRDPLCRQREILANQLSTVISDLKHVGTPSIEYQTKTANALQTAEDLLAQYKEISDKINALNSEINQYAELCERTGIEIK